MGVVVADILLFGRSDSFDRIPLKKRTVGFPFWRINVGNTLGVCLIPIVAFGFVPLFYALRPSGLFTAWVAVGLLGYVFGTGLGGHAITAYMSIVVRAREGLADKSPDTRALDSVLSEQNKVYKGVSFVIPEKSAKVDTSS